MIAGDTYRAHTHPWLLDQRRVFTRCFIPLLGVGFVWWMYLTAPTLGIWLSLVIYAVVHLILVGAGRLLSPHITFRGQGLLDIASTTLDVVFCLLLLLQAEALTNSIGPIYILLALQSLTLYRRVPGVTLIPFLFGPLYLFAAQAYVSDHALGALAQPTYQGLLVGSMGFGVLGILRSAYLQRKGNALQHDLRNAQQIGEARISELERTANDLRARVREMHAIEEGLRVITSTLSLDEVLEQIVDNTFQMLSSTGLHGVTLSLLADGKFDNRTFMLDGSTHCPWVVPLVQRVIQQHVPLIISDTSADAELPALMPQNLRSALCVPLFVGEGPPRGALTVVSMQPAAFSSSDARHLIGFAIQAGIAIHNAEMHSRLRQQQQLLQAVVRDIKDGLIVLDVQGQIVLANPIGYHLMDSVTTTKSVHEHLLELTASMRDADMPTSLCELRLLTPEDEPECVYQAFASQVRHDLDDEPLIAIVLRDISAQKIEERTRQEFISMVSHELRNPLHSLNGFIKVILQGRAGSLTRLQREFLEIVDSQSEQLKGRIAELLEFNRLEAGKLKLNPQWNDLSLLVTGIATRLKLQAENAGLELFNEVATNLPECYFDSERIGQVITNLVENAIKATPPGGTITLRSEQHEDEVWIRVFDTGVGIPAEEQRKIFQQFYRAHNSTSSQGNHLGLGLAICQQLVEGHKGRIWVESEEGRGSCFTFTLPLLPQEEPAVQQFA